MIVKRIVRILTFTIFAAIISVSVRWYSYVTNTSSPYDEVGIEFNRYMPRPIRKWGCDKLRATFGNVAPPLGCAAEGGNGREWI